MIGDPRDAWTYRVAIGALGLALVVVITGAIVLAALDGPSVTISSKTSPAPQNGLATKTDPGSRAVSISPNVSIAVADPTDPGGSKIPTGLYVLGGALIAALLGIMIPLSWPPLPSREGRSSIPKPEWVAFGAAFLTAIGPIVVIAAVTVLGLPKKWAPHEYVAIVGAAALLGLFVPSPAKRG